MILRLIALIPSRQWGKIQSVLNPEGKVALTNWLLAERNQLDNYILDYATPELRRIERKALKGKATEDELNVLNVSKKVFIGNLRNNVTLRNQKSIDMINQNIKYIRKYEDLINQLNQEISGVNSDVLILGERLSNININPRKFVDLVYSQIFDIPQWVLDEIKTLINLKLMSKDKLLFDNPSVLIDKLKGLGIDINENSDNFINLCKVEVDENIESSDIIQAIITSFSSAYKLDKEFDYDVYLELREIFPQYHNVNVEWLMNFFSSHIGSYKPYVSNLIDFDLLGALYRKGVELTCSL